MAVEALKKIVGVSNINDSPKILREYSGDLSFAPHIKPGCVVRPANVNEVQEIVKWANETKTPLVPMSSGAPHFRGDTVPGKNGTIIVDLSRMKRIIHIDTKNKVAMVEPGVTYDELQKGLEKEGLGAYMPLAPRRTKSVIGSVLEREPIIMPAHHWDSTDPLLCAEVVFGTGDRFRTGEASGPDTVEEQWEMNRVQMNPFGHSHVDFQRLLSGAQGTIGIVTWATLKCCYLSKSSRALLVPSDSLEPLIDLIYQPLKYRLGGKLFILNSLNAAGLMGKNATEIEVLKRILPLWLLFISFEGYGVLPEEKIAWEEIDFKAMAESCKLKAMREIGGVNANELCRTLNQSSSEPYWKTRNKGGFQDIFFLTTLDKTPEFIKVMNDTARQQKYPLENIGVYIQPMVQGTSCHCEFNLYYDPSKGSEVEATKKLVSTASEKIAGTGGFFSRPYSAWQDTAYRRAMGTQNMQEKIKAIFDPNAILNPGKLCF